MRYSWIPVTEYSEPITVEYVYACFELNACDAPILRAIKSYALAMDWRDADLENRYIICFTLDHEPEVSPPRDLFEWARRNAEAQS